MAQYAFRAVRVGTLFTPGEVNSVSYQELSDAALRKNGIDLVAVAVNTPGEVADAGLSLCGQQIGAICQISDNLCLACFPSILSTSERAGIPVFCLARFKAHRGAVLALSRDYYDAGCEGVLVATRLMRGGSPGGTPLKTQRGPDWP